MLNDWQGESAVIDAERRGSAEGKGRGFFLKDFLGSCPGRDLPRSGWRARWGLRVSTYIRRVLVDHVFVQLLMRVVNLLLSQVATASFCEYSRCYLSNSIR